MAARSHGCKRCCGFCRRGGKAKRRHCEERSDEAIQSFSVALDCFAPLAMTKTINSLPPCGEGSKNNLGGKQHVTDTFDFVVVGGGSGGCAVAGRLSEDPQTSVALLDAGGKNDNWVVTTPFALVLMVTGNVNNWAFSTVPQKGLNGRIGYQPRGKGLGGSSAINAMVYIRGHRSDY